MSDIGSQSEIDRRIDSLHGHGIVDLHFDLLMELYEKRNQPGIVAKQFLPEFEAGGIGVIGAAIYIEDRYVPERALQVGVDQISRLYAEVDQSDRFAICTSYQEIVDARAAGKIALIITMEGVEPLGDDLDLLRVFYELGVRVIGLTHARRNAACDGGVFAPTGSPPNGLTSFGRALVSECERLGVIVDLAHISPAGFDDILEITTKPLIVSHTNARRYYDIERNVSDDQIKAVGARGGVIGINSVLLSPRKEEATVEHYIDHIEHVVSLIGIDGVGVGFDFFEFLYRQWSEEEKAELRRKFTEPHFPTDLSDHSHSRNVTRRLIERGFSDHDIEKILFGNWMRIFKELL